MKKIIIEDNIQYINILTIKDKIRYCKILLYKIEKYKNKNEYCTIYKINDLLSYYITSNDTKLINLIKWFKEILYNVELDNNIYIPYNKAISINEWYHNRIVIIKNILVKLNKALIMEDTKELLN